MGYVVVDLIIEFRSRIFAYRVGIGGFYLPHSCFRILIFSIRGVLFILYVYVFPRIPPSLVYFTPLYWECSGVMLHLCLRISKMGCFIHCVGISWFLRRYHSVLNLDGYQAVFSVRGILVLPRHMIGMVCLVSRLPSSGLQVILSIYASGSHSL